MKKLAAIFLFLASVSYGQISEHEKKDYLEYLDTQAREAIHDGLHVAPEDSADFWAIYNRYANEKNALTSRFMDLIDGYTREFEVLTEDQEYKMVHQAIELRKDDLRLKEKYFELISHEINIPTAAAFYQNEMYYQTQSRLEVMEKIPFIGQ